MPEGTTAETAPPTVSPKYAKTKSHIAAPVSERDERAEESIAEERRGERADGIGTSEPSSLPLL